MILQFPTRLQVPLDRWVDVAMDWLLEYCGDAFEILGNWILVGLMALEKFFVWLPWPVLIIIVFLLGWRLVGRLRDGLLLATLLFLVGCFGYWDLAMMTLALIMASVSVSLVIGIPTGILMAASDRFSKVLKPILDGMQTMPSFVYLIPAMMLFGLGKVPALFATIIYAVPPVIRLTNVGIREVDPSIVEAAHAFGADPWKVLTSVELPLARPSIMVGINQTTMMALSMVVIASMIGARGLGLEVLLAINRIEIGRGVKAGMAIVFLAIIVDRITAAMAAERRMRKGGGS
ncbi:ProW [Desulforapulum autotrophicum HRM2]|jgi:glycine betaine/proline transport system permease protein|uniref:ProW n=1 Tax=Desulforapulum autotrophicum (strain ATCC 43914 / DSM 3382 / VKM B-1955 / HRM2) TaxID=177437 RepID=C0QAT4_DESAH|nr:ABC transporter permease subunit [Desulforapulum autotrophicum]ACN16867.1 ProW [Desulforapulum autotrophicum HRM2]